MTLIPELRADLQAAALRPDRRLGHRWTTLLRSVLAPRRRRADRPSVRRHRGPLALGLVAAAAAAGAFAVVNLDSGGHGAVAEANAALIVAHARRALVVAPGQVLEVTMSGPADGSNVRIAQDGATPQDYVATETGGDFLPTFSGQQEWTFGQENGMQEFFDPATNTIYRDSDTSKAMALTPPRQLLADVNTYAKATVDANTMLNGQPATLVKGTYANGSANELWVDPDSDDRPLRFTVTSPAGATQTTTWTNYQTVTPSASSPSPALLTAQHPSATIVTLHHADYVAQQSQIYTAAGGH